MERVNENASLGLKCFKKRGDRENTEVQLYESFIYDGVKYMLYDCVYMYNGDNRDPYVGKLTKIWELPDKTKKFAVRWFFRPEEISNWLGDTKTLENEIFLATGEGRGLTNINSLDAIICPCNVVCLSKDNRNPQPSDEQRKAADFVFYRAFDVQNRAILDEMDDDIGGLEIKYLFNRKESEKTSPFIGSTSDMNEENLNIKKSNEKLHDRPLKKIKSDDKCVEAGVACDFKKMTDLPSMVNMADKGEMKTSIVPVEQMGNTKRKNKTPTGSDELHDLPLKKLKSDKKPPEEKRVTPEFERFDKMSLKKSMVDSKSKHLEKSHTDVNNMITAKVTSDDLECKKYKERRDDGSFKVHDNKTCVNTNVKDLGPLSKAKFEISLDIRGNKNNYNIKEAKEGSAVSSDKVNKNTCQIFVVGPKPNAETSRWFKQPPWEVRLKKAYDKGTAILLHNLDPYYNSRDIENIIWHAFKEDCDAKILQHTSVSSPHYAQALILLKTKEAAHRILTKLDEKCLMLSHGSQIFMPLVGTPCPPISTKKNPIFFGHLTIDKARFKNQHEDEAVSTSHFSQSNTIEYDMAMEWCVLQFKSAKWWEKFHEQQRRELENLKNNLKRSVHKASYSC